MKVTRDGDTFDVLDLKDDWQFWQKRFSTDWEPETKAVIERFVDGGTFVDIGAWVGPTTLWASRRAGFVLAVEPDPVAYEHLEANTADLPNVAQVRCAVGEPGQAVLLTNGALGDSMSSLTSGTATHWTTDVLDMRTLLTICPDNRLIQLIKMDIEGGEGVVIPREHDYLKRLGAPLLLSLHPNWWPEDPRPYLDNWSHYEEISRNVGLWIP